MKAPCSITKFACNLPKIARSVLSPSVKKSVEGIKIRKIVTLRMVGCCLVQILASYRFQSCGDAGNDNTVLVGSGDDHGMNDDAGSAGLKNSDKE